MDLTSFIFFLIANFQKPLYIVKSRIIFVTLVSNLAVKLVNLLNILKNKNL